VRWRLLAVFGVLASLLVVASAANVTIIKSAEADYAGTYLKPYYENRNAPVTGCTSPCLTVDTQGTEPNPTSGTLSLDGHGIGINTPSSPATISVTTLHANDVVVLMVMCNPGVTSMSVSGGGLTWNTRIAIEVIGTRSGAEFWAYAPSALSGATITVNFGGSGAACNPAYIGITGANTANPFDTNANLPVIVNANSPATCTMSTSNPNDILFGYMMQGGTSTPSGPSGWTALDTYPAAEHWDYYDIVGSTVSSTAESWAAGSGNISGFCDAVVQGSGSFTLSAGSSMSLWSPQFAAATSIPAGVLSFQLFADAPAPALDGTATGTWASGTTITLAGLSTTKTNDVVVLSIVTYKSGASVTATGILDGKNAITWQKSARSSSVFCSGTQEVTETEWYGTVANTISADAISVALSSAPTAGSAIVIGVSGADTTTPFDPAAGLPKTASSTCTSTGAAPTVPGVSTLADTDFVLALFGGYTSVTETVGNIGAGSASIANTVTGTGDSNAVEYKAMTSSQSSDSCAFGASTTYWGILCDALMSARQSVTISYYTTNSAGVVQSTMASASPATITALYQPVSITSSAGTVPASGYIEVVITGPSGAALSVFWGIPKPTLFEVSFTYRT
jgi:hypothetical protein